MNTHKGARTTPYSRQLMVDRLAAGQSVATVAAAFGVSATCVHHWRRRFAAEGPAGLATRSSRPHRCRAQTPAAVVDAICALRRQRLPARTIADRVGCSPATVSRILGRAGLRRLRDLVPPPPVERYEHAAPGALVHLDIKKLGRFRMPGHRVTGDRRGQQGASGWESLHVAIDDHSRLAFACLAPDERAASAVAALERTVAWYRAHGVAVRAILTDNGSAYRSHAFRAACVRLGIRHRRTRPYRPQTNGKAERFIRTLLGEWAYARAYPTSGARAAALAPYLARYNLDRRHQGIGNVPPITRIAIDRNNVLSLYT